MRSDGDARIPCDCRIYDKFGDGKTKNAHFSGMLFKAKIRGYELEDVIFVRNYGWFRMTGLKLNRLVNP